MRRGQRPGSRAGLHEAYREAAGCLRGGGRAAGKHHEKLTVVADLGQVGFKASEVVIDDVQDVGVGNGRGGALVLAQIPDHLVRERDPQLRIALPEDVAHPQLVLRVAIGVQQTNADRTHAESAQLIGQRSHSSLGQRPVDGPVGQDPFSYCEGEPTWHQRLGFLQPRVVHVEAVLAADQQGVAEPFSDEQRGPCALALADGVGHQRRTVHHGAQRLRRQLTCLQLAHQRGAHTGGRLANRGQHLADLEAATLPVYEQQVRESPADIDSCPPLATWHRSSSPRASGRHHAGAPLPFRGFDLLLKEKQDSFIGRLVLFDRRVAVQRNHAHAVPSLTPAR